METDYVKLNEWTKEEWWDLAATLCKDLTEEEFNQMWADFQLLKKKKKMQ